MSAYPKTPAGRAICAAVFLPVDADARPFDLIPVVEEGIAKGLRLYTNGRQFALFRRPIKGWAPFAIAVKPETPPCAA